MAIDEVEVYVTPNGLGRAAIVRRSDGLLCVYVHIKLPAGYMPQHFAPSKSDSWVNDRTPKEDLYKDREPSSGLFGTVEDARRHIRSMPNLAEAALLPFTVT
jgi:hypothetical protein